MNQNCIKCDAKIGDERYHLGYKECVDMWRELGLTCFEVEEAIF